MSKDQTYTLEQAINTMRNYTEIGRPFTLVFTKLDGSCNRVEKAILRPMATKGKNAAYKLQYTNVITGEHRSCYIPLLMYVNHIKIKIK